MLIGWHAEATKALGAEGYKTVLQFLLIAVLGGGVSLFYQAYNREADRRAELVRREEDRVAAVRETRRRYLAELIAQYNTVKRARRLLRAKALTDAAAFPDRRVRMDHYDDLLQPVLDAQLALETMSRTLGEPGIDASLCTAEAYLRLLIAEYEEVMPKGRPEISVRSMPVLAGFVGPYDQADRFRNDFVHPMQAALTAVERLITGQPA